LADSRQNEDLLYDHRAADEGSDVQADDRQQPEYGVVQSVAQQDAPRSGALRDRGRDVVLPSKLLDQVAAQEPGIEASQRQGDGQRGQNHRLHVPHDALADRCEADRRKDPQPNSEYVDEQQGEDVTRQ
jgi:hypothetical protein